MQRRRKNDFCHYRVLDYACRETVLFEKSTVIYVDTIVYGRQFACQRELSANLRSNLNNS